LIGARVRISAVGPDGGAQIGLLLRRDASAIELAADDGSTSVLAVSQIVKLEVSAGKRRHTLAGALCGAALGLAVALIGSCTGEDCGLYRATGVALLTPAGAGVGALVGSAIKTERWQTVPIAAQPNAGKSSGARLTVTLRF